MYSATTFAIRDARPHDVPERVRLSWSTADRCVADVPYLLAQMRASGWAAISPSASNQAPSRV
jgi:hypothetical protein